MYVLRTEFQRWEENCSDTAACGKEQSLFLISISASHCPTLLLCLQTNESQNNLWWEHYFIGKLIPFFPLCIVSFCPPPSVSLIFQWQNIQFWKFVVFNCNIKERKKCFQMDKKSDVLGIIICNLALEWRLIEEESFVIKKKLFLLLHCFPPGTQVWCRVHTHAPWEVTAIVILFLKSAV